MSSSAQPSRSMPLRRSSWLRPKYLLFAFIGLLYVYVLIHSEGFLINPKDEEWQHIASFKWWLLPHGLAGACALILGPMQFSDRLRQRFTKLHRVMGRFYIASVFVAAPLGVYIQYLDEPLGSPRSFTIETVVQSGLWLVTTAIALAFILRGKVQQHRQWMTRSFGTGPLIFLEARVIFHLAGVTTPFQAETVVWICTACSIFVADLVLQFQEMLRTRPIIAKKKNATPVLVAELIEVLPDRQE
jgi:uncharacterized membrane protein